MKRKIYWSMCLMSLLTIVLASFLTTWLYYSDLQVQMRREVITEARYIVTGMDLSGKEYLDNLAGNMKGSNRNRVTLIDTDGTVIFDNYKDNDSLENHGDRPEVQDAMERGVGEVTRTSSTLSEKTFYYAIRMDDGTILRVANTMKSTLASLVRLLPWIGAMAAVILGMGMLMADILTKQIVKPINNVNLDSPGQAVIYDELSPLIGRIEKQKQTIRTQIQTLKEKQIEFSAITENMSEGFIVVDAKAEVVSYNSSAIRILGVDSLSVSGVRINILNFNRSSQFRQAVEGALNGLHSEQNLMIDGSYYQLIANPVMNEKQLKGAVIVILDVTEKQNREDLRREFSANVSHELKTPLTSISGYAEIMKNGLVKTEDMGRFAQNIYTEAQRLITLVEDIIKISQLDENVLEVEKTGVDLYDLAFEIQNRLSDNAAAQKVSINLEGDHQVVSGARQILDEMIYNLCDNAIKYNKVNGKVDIRISEENGSPVITVADTGIGIPEADRERVFERFYRVDKSHSKKIGGTGLGLSIVKHGAIYHNARVEMKSCEAEGTEVKIIF